ncbi:unnamed protein product [Brassica oleracea]
MRSSVLRSLRGRLVINLESTRKLRLSRTNIGPGRKKGQKSIKSKNMARKGNPISVRLGKNRSSDSSRGSFYGGVTIDSIYYYGKFVYQDVMILFRFDTSTYETHLWLSSR